MADLLSKVLAEIVADHLSDLSPGTYRLASLLTHSLASWLTYRLTFWQTGRMIPFLQTSRKFAQRSRKLAIAVVEREADVVQPMPSRSPPHSPRRSWVPADLMYFETASWSCTTVTPGSAFARVLDSAAGLPEASAAGLPEQRRDMAAQRSDDKSTTSARRFLHG